MAYPPLVKHATEAEYRAHFERVYCQGPLPTFDGIQVRFRKRDFDHCFFESVKKKDDTFSPRRAERVEWIKAALEDPNADLRVGWDNTRKMLATDRRVAIVMHDYLVVIRLTDHDAKQAEFVTAFVASGRAIQQARRNPPWPRA